MDLRSQLPDSPDLSYLSEAIETKNLLKFKQTLSHLLSAYCVSDLLNLYWIMNLACEQNLPGFASELLHQGVKFYIQFAQIAAARKATDVLETFIQLGVWDINQTIDGWTPPLLGNVVDDKSMVEWFIKHGADPNKRCAIDITPLSKAAERAPVPTIKFMLENGGDANRGCLLHHAIYRGDDCVDTLELLLSYEADINYIMYDSEKDRASFDMMPFTDIGTPLHAAIEEQNFKAAQYLLQHGADVNRLDQKNRSPLDLAKERGNSEFLHLVKGYS